MRTSNLKGIWLLMKIKRVITALFASEVSVEKQLPTLLLKRYYLIDAIFSCRATTSGIPFSVVVAGPLRFRIWVLAFAATRRVLEG